MPNARDESAIQAMRRTVIITNDFTDVDSADRGSTVAATTGTADLATGANAVGGKLLLSTAAAANDDVYHHTQEVFKFETDKTTVVECQFEYSEAATNVASLMFGLMDGIAADAIVDGGGPKAAYSGAVIYKNSGDLLWRTEASTDGGANKETGVSNLSTTTGATTLRIEATPLTATTMDVTFMVDPNGGSSFEELVDSKFRTLKVTGIDISTVTEMSMVFGVKAGSAAIQTALVDAWGTTMLRGN